MKHRDAYELPPEKQEQLRRAVRLEWVTIFFMISIIAVMYLAMGSSQAMKTAWIEDILSLIPPITFLIALRMRNKEPTDRYPYGFRRAPMLAFQAASAAVLVMGLYMLYDSASALISRHHPTLGHFTLYGTNWEIWSGWVMIGALLYSMVPPVVLGKMKLPLSKDLHEKTLYADAVMNKADWMTAGAAIVGVLGIGIGLWWADAAAAAFISIDVIRDGAGNLKRSMADLMDQQPTEASTGKRHEIVDQLRGHIRGLPGVVDADVRLREEGHVVVGEIFVVLTDDGAITPARLESISKEARDLDWRLYDLIVVPVDSLEHHKAEETP